MAKTLGAVAAGMGAVVALMLVLFIGLSLFAGGPTGRYHVDTSSPNHIGAEKDATLVASVVEEWRFRADKEVYRGPPAFAWQLYWRLTGAPAMSLPKTADL